MIAVCVIAAIAIAALAYILQVQERSHQEARGQWVEERRELLNRIQRPEFVPMNSTPFQIPDEPEDEYNLVGTIRHDSTSDFG